MKTTASTTLNAMWNSAVILRHVGLEGAHGVGDRVQERRDEHDADQPVEQVPDRQPIARRIAAVAALEQRIDGAAEIGAQHQRQGRRSA